MSRVLLEHNADVNALSDEGQSPLITAAGRAFFAAYAPGRRLVYAPRDAPVGGAS